MSSALIVLKKIATDKLFSSYLKYTENKDESSFADFCADLYNVGAQDSFSSYVANLILYDENIFSFTCAQKKAPSPFVEKAFLQDLKKIYELVFLQDTKEMYSVGSPCALFEKDWGNLQTLNNLKNYYARYGYGDFIRYKAFTFANKKLTPIVSESTIRLSDLKDYVEEKKIISSNIENFLAGYPHSNMLLYGERGTGKSSTIHAMLNQYYPDRLRIVELSKENMLDLNTLKEKLSAIPLKFIVYLDDLSLNAGDERISSLKAALEGCMEGNASNVMIVATSNRRHIIDEKFSNRDDSIHAGDSMQEELSLSDRFGISVLFSTTTKPQYLSIINQMAEDKSLTISLEELDSLAERWALLKGGRSPRRAKQFIDLAIACQQKNVEIEF